MNNEKSKRKIRHPAADYLEYLLCLLIVSTMTGTTTLSQRTVQLRPEKRQIIRQHRWERESKDSWTTVLETQVKRQCTMDNSCGNASQENTIHGHDRVRLGYIAFCGAEGLLKSMLELEENSTLSS
ncbi:hypothetical protein J6590_068682 [Homalodisca vitripennis]|nr:hypothetical protein J6590_068682 [Homalodisca vitripennis]